MPTYHVKRTTGNDLAAGTTAETAWKSLRRAILHASANDTIIVDAADKDSAIRGLVVVNKDITIKPLNNTDEIFMSPAYPIMHGEVYAHLDKEDYCQTFAANTTGGGWALSAGAATSLDNTNKLIGANCLMLDAASARQTLRQAIGHYNNKPERYRILLKLMDAGSKLRLIIRGASDTFGFDTRTGEWESGLQNNDYTVADLGSDWVELITPWINGRTETGQYVQIQAEAGGRILIQRIAIEYMAEWTDFEGRKQLRYSRPSGTGTYAISEAQIPSVGDVVYHTGPWIQKCTAAEWESTGTQALKIVPPAQSYAAMTPGTYFYSNTDTGGTLWYMPEDGEDFDALHIEAARGMYGMELASTCSIIRPRVFGGQAGFKFTAGAPFVWYPIEEQSVIKGYNSEGSSTPVLRRPRSRQTEISTAVKQRGGGFFATGTSVMEIHGGDCYRTGDDSLQCAQGGSLKVHGFTSRQPTGADCELINSSGTPSHEFYNVSGMRGSLDTVSFMDQGTGSANVTVAMDNCAWVNMLWQNSITRNYTIGNNVYCQGSAGGASGGATVPAEVASNVNFNATLGYTDAANGDLTPTTDSDLYRAGTPGLAEIGGDGEPFARFDTDAGGIQSTHGPFHPSNL